MKKNNKDEYAVLFSGSKLSKSEANKAGLGLVSGVIGFIISLLIIGIDNKIPAFIVGIVCTFMSYYVIGKRLFRKKQ